VTGLDQKNVNINPSTIHNHHRIPQSQSLNEIKTDAEIIKPGLTSSLIKQYNLQYQNKKTEPQQIQLSNLVNQSNKNENVTIKESLSSKNFGIKTEKNRMGENFNCTTSGGIANMSFDDY
jgi:hypothetical protein